MIRAVQHATPPEAVADSGAGSELRVVLVCMPWALLDMPSLAVSTLVPVATETAKTAQVDVVYANLRWCDYLTERTGGRIGAAQYQQVVEGYYHALGEWIFSPALYGADDPMDTPFYLTARANGADLDDACEMYRLAPGFVMALATELVDAGYDVVGLTSTFDQNMPSLALARAVKERSPRVITVMGGANCDDEQGAALHRSFPAVDFVVRGEGELTFLGYSGPSASAMWSRRRPTRPR
ncbi:cobalamin-dependent protein [Natronosporangium hydrolyticum]|uniref:Cobalamin-dependent protein n=1 Tax=Natronosporangium hydrolyticum TaxID=2811111 RepID=A0A895YGK5_9ACTN|nr:cobalamin-dependent protein [Natronosporangium hydrolyticum]QSB17014.1 cobalamin-dependent protein [Natronosporangium hydrolyticum]